jgi:hypothetical protein
VSIGIVTQSAIRIYSLFARQARSPPVPCSQGHFPLRSSVVKVLQIA